ncbi:hypothetical protein HK099_003134 [Clydaea vesicula]|uniref:Uncharacterized protein n=1 Tax=Clydaea vesicula TaxID=447962 RepID=A0AAD5U8F8_9FUNG|nr:hypothetical protein HK099_003134 [Clydaea vesicula]KAJ3395823.1 hypothetical protein HDU92_004836 [Lobulomyces angularis]
MKSKSTSTSIVQNISAPAKSHKNSNTSSVKTANANLKTGSPIPTSQKNSRPVSSNSTRKFNSTSMAFVISLKSAEILAKNPVSAPAMVNRTERFIQQYKDLNKAQQKLIKELKAQIKLYSESNKIMQARLTGLEKTMQQIHSNSNRTSSYWNSCALIKYRPPINFSSKISLRRALSMTFAFSKASLTKCQKAFSINHSRSSSNKSDCSTQTGINLVFATHSRTSSVSSSKSMKNASPNSKNTAETQTGASESNSQPHSSSHSRSNSKIPVPVKQNSASTVKKTSTTQHQRQDTPVPSQLKSNQKLFTEKFSRPTSAPTKSTFKFNPNAPSFFPSSMNFQLSSQAACYLTQAPSQRPPLILQRKAVAPAKKNPLNNPNRESAYCIPSFSEAAFVPGLFSLPKSYEASLKPALPVQRSRESSQKKEKKATSPLQKQTSTNLKSPINSVSSSRPTSTRNQEAGLSQKHSQQMMNKPIPSSQQRESQFDGKNKQTAVVSAQKNQKLGSSENKNAHSSSIKSAMSVPVVQTNKSSCPSSGKSRK